MKQETREIKSVTDLLGLKPYTKVKIRGMEGVLKNIMFGDSITSAVILKESEKSIKEIKYVFCSYDRKCKFGKVIIYDKGTPEYNDCIKFLMESSI